MELKIILGRCELTFKDSNYRDLLNLSDFCMINGAYHATNHSTLIFDRPTRYLVDKIINKAFDLGLM